MHIEKNHGAEKSEKSNWGGAMWGKKEVRFQVTQGKSVEKEEALRNTTPKKSVCKKRRVVVQTLTLFVHNKGKAGKKWKRRIGFGKRKGATKNNGENQRRGESGLTGGITLQNKEDPGLENCGI